MSFCVEPFLLNIGFVLYVVLYVFCPVYGRAALILSELVTVVVAPLLILSLSSLLI